VTGFSDFISGGGDEKEGSKEVVHEEDSKEEDRETAEGFVPC
jgi:hypothetical protein